MAYTTTEVLQIADICQFLAKDNESKGNLFRGSYLRNGLSRFIYIVKSSVNWLFTYNPSDSTLLGKVNLLFSLCQPFVGQALQIIGSGGSGTIVNPATGVQSTIEVVYLEFIVGVTSSPQVVNGVNVTLPTSGGTQIVLPIPNILNKSISVTKDNTPLPIALSDRSSFTPIYTIPSVTINVNDDFSNGDLFVIQGLQYVSV
jgi:hypothetical protein